MKQNVSKLRSEGIQSTILEPSALTLHQAYYHLLKITTVPQLVGDGELAQLPRARTAVTEGMSLVPSIIQAAHNHIYLQL